MEIIIIFVYYSCSQTAITTSILNQQAVTQDGTDTTEYKAGIQPNMTQGLARVYTILYGYRPITAIYKYKCWGDSDNL